MEPTPTSYSCPDQPVRHCYPLTVNSEGLGTAIGIFMKTLPFVALRLGILIGFTLVTVIWIAICAGIAALFTSKDGGGGGIIFFLIAVGLPFGVLAWLKHYVLYLLKLAHVAVITELLVHGSVPQGGSQIAYGKKAITDRFAQTNILFAVDALVKAIVSSFNSTLDWIGNLLPIPGMDSAMQIVNRIVSNATTFIDETIFSYNIARGDENVFRSSLDGLVYYAQNAKPVLKTAVIALLMEYAVTGIAFLICLIPAWMIGAALPASVSSYAWIIALLLAGAVRSAVLRPLFLTMVAISFHVNSKDKAINLDMADTLQSCSDKFGELSTKAREWVGSKAAPAGNAPRVEAEPA